MNGALRIDAVTTPGGGTIGMLHCPGRIDLRRDLAADMAAVRAWKADALLTLIGHEELADLGVPDLPQAAAAAGLSWHHVPIVDLRTPDDDTVTAWRREGPQVLALLRSGGRIAVHCAAGLGRTGLVVAKLLVMLGATAEEAIAAVREARPGTIETRGQERFVRTSPLLDLPG